VEADVQEIDPVIDVADADFYQNVLQLSHELPVVVDFWSPGCPPCRLLGPLLERLVRERQGSIVLAKVNVEDAPQVANHYQIEVVPTVKAFRDGQPILEFAGLLPEAQLRQFLDELSPSAAEQQAQAARARASKDPAEAEKEYHAALEKEPTNDEALVGLAELLHARGELAEAEKLLEPASPSGEIGARADRLRGLIALERIVGKLGDAAAIRQRYEADPNSPQALYEMGCLLAREGKHEEALAKLLAAGERDFKLAGDQVRKAMVHVFHIVGERSELADSYRRQLTRLLY
jgi:putative thioredoxin